MNGNLFETVTEIAERERKRKVIIESIIDGLRNHEQTTEQTSALEELVGDLAGLIEFDYVIQGTVQDLIRDHADLVGETDRCEALFAEYGLG